ncbi:MAG: CRISPR-associated ring nuclease Csm6 [Roseimicrobium sp.]
MSTTLLAVSGMSPAILTETVWALAKETPPTVADEVIVITTTKGLEDIHRDLLARSPVWEDRNVWETLRRDVFALTRQATGCAKLQLSLRVIELPDPATGVRLPAEDLRTREHLDEAANFIIQTISPIVDAEDQHVIASIAGGRKTMGALLYAAMSLLGKESDRVTHVLVNEPFENVRGFFYPNQPVRALVARPFDKPAFSVSADAAVVELADIPFVPLRNKFTELNEPRRTFAGIVQAYSRSDCGSLKQPPHIQLDEKTGIFTVEGRTITLKGRDLLITAFLTARANAGESHFANKDQAAVPLAEFMKGWNQRQSFHKATAKLSGEISVDDIPKALSPLRAKLKKIGLEGAISYLAPDRDRIGFDIPKG